MPFTIRAAIPLLFALSAVAQQPPARALKVAVIDTEKILVSSAMGKRALSDLKKLGEKKELEIQTRAQAIKELETRISAGSLTLSKDKVAQLQQDHEDKVIALKRLQDDAARELNTKRDAILDQIDQKIMPIINQVGKEQGYAFIFRKFESGLIFADDAYDITAVIIKRLDAVAK